MKYVLDENGEPRLEDDALKWAAWFETADRAVMLTELGGGVNVSTVFLALDHSFGRGGAPVLWETMIFDGPRDGYCKRARSREEAIENHHRAVAFAEGHVIPIDTVTP